MPHSALSLDTDMDPAENERAGRTELCPRRPNSQVPPNQHLGSCNFVFPFVRPGHKDSPQPRIHTRCRQEKLWEKSLLSGQEPEKKPLSLRKSGGGGSWGFLLLIFPALFLQPPVFPRCTENKRAPKAMRQGPFWLTRQPWAQVHGVSPCTHSGLLMHGVW